MWLVILLCAPLPRGDGATRLCLKTLMGRPGGFERKRAILSRRAGIAAPRRVVYEHCFVAASSIWPVSARTRPIRVFRQSLD
jgi:hypothetical protein